MAHDITAARQYDAYGQLVGASGTWAGPFGYQTDETGLQLLGHRYYDSSTGRFLTRDPIKDGRNWYVYCENDPINGTDPTGLLLQQVGHPGFGENLIPVWGSGRSSIAYFEEGEVGLGILFAAMAISDVFLVKGLVGAGGKVAAGAVARATIKAGLSKQSIAQKFGIQSYRALRKAVKGLGLQVHQLIEKVFWYLPDA